MLVGAIAFSILFRNYRYSPLISLVEENPDPNNNNNDNNNQIYGDETNEIELEDIIKQVD